VWTARGWHGSAGATAARIAAVRYLLEEGEHRGGRCPVGSSRGCARAQGVPVVPRGEAHCGLRGRPLAPHRVRRHLQGMRLHSQLSPLPPQQQPHTDPGCITGGVAAQAGRSVRRAF